MNKNKIDTLFVSYCSGCGLCSSCNGTQLYENEKGFLCPKLSNSELQEKICPASMCSCSKTCKSDNIWGDFVSINRGYSLDPVLRKKASSGGLLSEIACYLIDNKKVDGIIHIGVGDNPLSTKVYVSNNRSEVISHAGSRYIQSSPLVNICKILGEGGVYAFVGKPCDIMTLKNYIRVTDGIKGKIEYYLSFFCAGIPSMVANKELIAKMGCDKEIDSLTYRGNGWPGYAHAVARDGNEYFMSYSESWGRILGRDKHKMCRLCMDGIGIDADIVCADAWYIKNGTPDFSERDGRNIVICRTDKGDRLYKEVLKAGTISSEKYDEYAEEMPIIQKYQFERRSTMAFQVAALKIFHIKVPKYKFSELRKFLKYTNYRTGLKIFWGTLKRVYRGRYS